ncbi:MAG: DUF1700 domain-containing protein [Pseudomonadota bacterium]
MTDPERIESYTNDLAKALAPVATTDRDEIIREIRAHLEQRADEGRLTEALEGLGSPQACARAFRQELALQDAFDDGSPVRTFRALLANAARNVIASVGLFVTGLFMLIAIGLAFTAFVEIVSPQTTGLWVNAEHSLILFGTLDEGRGDGFTEILGFWYVPLALLAAVILFVVGQKSARLCLGLMIRRNRKQHLR